MTNESDEMVREKKERTKERKESKCRGNYFERLNIVLFNSQWQKSRSYSTQNSNAMTRLARTFCMLLDSKVSKSCSLVSFLQNLSRQDTLSRLENNVIRFLTVKLFKNFLLPLTRRSSD